MLTLLTILAAQPVSLPPAPPAPPPVHALRIAAAHQSGTDAPPVRLFVRATAGGETIWQGSLNVGRSGGASFNQSKTEAGTGACPRRPYDASIRSAFTINISPDYGGGEEGGFRFAVGWTRPAPGTSCPPTGTRTVELNQSAPVPRGGTAVLEGDGGLSVRVERRD